MNQWPANQPILFVIKGLDIGNINGGAEKFSIDLANQLKQSGLNILMCVFFQMFTPAEINWTKQLDLMGIPYFFASTWKGNNHFKSYVIGIRNLQKYLQHNRAILCHSHFQLGTMASLFIKALGLTKYVIRTCQISQEWESGWYGWIREQLISKWVFPLFVDKEIGVSQAIVDRLGSYPGAKLFHKKPLFIPNAIQINPKNSINHKIKNPIKDKLIIGVVGRLSEQKGHRYLIGSLPKVLQVYKNIEIWLIGEGELRESLEQHVKDLGIQDHIVFWGRQEDMSKFYAEMDFCVLPSLWEGLPITVLEAFSYNVPVIATDIPGTREIVIHDETGWLVPPANIDALSSCMLSVLSDTKAHKRIIDNAKLKIRRFTLPEITKQYLEVYEGCLNSRWDF